MSNRLVVDSSVIIKWFVDEELDDIAETIRTEWFAHRIVCAVPDLMFVEIGNILWKKQRQQKLEHADALEIVEGRLRLRWRVTSTASLLDEAHQLAVQLDRTVYDSYY